MLDSLKRDAELAESIQVEDPVPPTKAAKRSGRAMCQDCGHYKKAFALYHRTICTNEKRSIEIEERCLKTFTGTRCRERNCVKYHSCDCESCKES
jgi:hypothetical protein